MAWVDRTVRDFVEAVASAEPTPGGGSVAALSAAFGAALLHRTGLAEPISRDSLPRGRLETSGPGPGR
jgi:hypothetical protein